MAWDQKPNPQGYVKDWHRIRLRVLQLARYECALKLEGIHEGKAKEVDHIDGDIENNADENLRALCSACHSSVTKQNWRDSRNLMDPRTDAPHPSRLVDDVATRVEATKEIEKKRHGVVDDLPDNDETTWIRSYGPVFETLETGEFKLPKRSLGGMVVMWIVKNLKIKGKPFIPTNEQVRILFWMYALDEGGRWEYTRALHVAPKGWGKDPFYAAVCAVEMCGPSRWAGWNPDGSPIATKCVDAWVQISAVSMHQNENTMNYLRSMFSDEAIVRYQIEIQSEVIYAFGRKSKIQCIASSSSSLEGNYPSFGMMSEGQHWLESNGCYKLYRVLTRNLAKVDNSHYIITTNAYNPNENSIAQLEFEAWEDANSGITKPSKTLMIARMATHKAPYETMEQRLKVLKKVYGSATKYTNPIPLAETFDNSANPLNESLRFYYNVIGLESHAFIDIRAWDRCLHPDYNPEIGIPKGTKIVLAGDMSKNDDATCLIGMVTAGKLSGTLFVVGIWEQPKNKELAKTWQVPREEVNAAVEKAFKDYNVQAFWVDPSHKMDDEGGSYWMPLINEWHRVYSRRIPLAMWAKGNEHAINWDMASHANQRSFVDSLATMEQLITDNQIRHDGNTDLRRHFQNARRFKSKRFGSTIAKESPRSKKKIDAAVTSTIALTAFNKLMMNRKTRTTNMTGYTVPERD